MRKKKETSAHTAARADVVVQPYKSIVYKQDLFKNATKEKHDMRHMIQASKAFGLI